MKKIFKIFGISLIAILVLLIVTPFLFQNQIKESVKTFLNDSVDAQIDFEDVGLGLLSSFPDANVVVHNLKVINQKTFKGETIATVKSLSFDMSIKELFKNENEGPIVVNSIQIDEAFLTIKSDKFGNNNYDIANETEDTSKESDTSFKLNIDD